MYTPLWVKSHHSFLEGASSPAELVDRAADLGLPALALTDRAGVYGLVRAHVRARERGLKLLLGAELELRERAGESVIGRGGSDGGRGHAGSGGGKSRGRSSGERGHSERGRSGRGLSEGGRSERGRDEGPADTSLGRVALLAPDRASYGRMCRLLTIGHTRGAKGEAWVRPEELAEMGRGLVVLSDAAPLLARLRAAGLPPGDLWAFCGRHLAPGEREREAALRAAAGRLGLGAVGGNAVLYHDRARRPLQDVVTCVRHGTTLSKAGRLLQPNGEHALLGPEVMASRFADAPELLAASRALAERCDFRLDQIRYRYPGEALPPGETEGRWLRRLAFEGAARRYPGGVPSAVRAQLERELAVIEDLDYGGYFLTMHEIVRHCGDEGILCQGRGSAANSAVCFCLGITAIDPVRMDLLFERFLSRERAEPPDIDLDIEHERREEVIQHVYGRYGRRRAAMVANVIRYRGRSAVREVGKALGVPATDLDAVARQLSHFGGDPFDDALARDAGLDAHAPTTRHLLRLAAELQDAPRHQSIHPGGFLLGLEPVDELVPIEPATMEGRTVIQWDKYDVEDLGLFKVDLLGLGALTCIRKAFELLQAHQGLELDIASVPAEDPATYEMVSAGDTVGVFQIESRAQMAMLPRLRPRTFYDLVIEVAIVRPGPIQGDMVHPYLLRRHGDEPVEYPHPKLRRVLEKTLGVPIFQEQVMKVAVAVAGYSPGEADQLRRDMAAWKSSGKIERHRDRMIPRMIESGIAPEFAERVFSQIRGFGEYGFPESHAASFALLAYVTAWLRCHHPAAFVCALLNAQPMGFYGPATLVDDAKRRGVEVRPVSVQTSRWDHTLEPRPEGGEALRIGLRLVKGLAEADGARVEAARGGGAFRDLADFVRRTRLGAKALVALAEAGAFEPLGVSRRDALWQVRGLVRALGDGLAETAPRTQLSFEKLSREEEVLWDYRATRHSPRGHPLGRFRAALAAQGMPTAAELEALPDGARTDFVGLVICRQRPITASGVTFATLEDETGFANLVLWRDVFEAHRVLAKTAVILGVSGRIQKAEGVTHLVAERLWPLPNALRPQAREIVHRSRDFR
ncbi:MAG TPA: error-prone DNA polymerase [Polyangiaceae bacterium LLY-WYZ-15_(1-7)]|nr:error-prone DNA polymerase [Polyangiaceae bacterium LLY-WYZ-15_(1-7)]HJL09706.1 error-prone DNA polymerase [Polyangiaceae bacterium LLY-WYZ-15_(1-7)]HJL26101.1 error-prone DNA polymerase [Polyangiaceae bacterium LLY-WYZ-15_(1-7)]HJL39600.1 error-prone DNA polymerase [Polyangiaceae bacterium LLY-WYZ-15_(1-7)]